jgi:peptidoglycan hydrolase-like protein with peptidoglycan-binding domain
MNRQYKILELITTTIMNKKIIPAVLIAGLLIGGTQAVFAQDMTMSNASTTMMTMSMLGLGAKGNDVVTLQQFLVAKGYLAIPSGVAMGTFGPLTQAAVIKYQTAVGITADGYVGSDTQAHLKADGGSSMNVGSTSMQASTKAADLRVAMNRLLREHVNLSLNVLRNAYDGSPQFAASADSLDKNTQDIATAVGSVYGQGAHDAFLKLWRNHIGFFANYTTGLKTNDAAKMQQAKLDLQQYSFDFATLMNGANPTYFVKAALMTNANAHVAQLLSSMDAYAKGDYATAYSLQREGDAHMGMVADYLSGGIVKQYPEKFN